MTADSFPGDLFPDDVAVVTDTELGMDDAALLASLYPVEVEQIGAAVERRRVDFAGARACARAAMTRLGVPPGPVLRGARGVPVPVPADRRRPPPPVARRPPVRRAADT